MRTVKVAFERTKNGEWVAWMVGKKSVQGRGSSLAEAKKAFRVSLRKNGPARGRIHLNSELHLPGDLDSMLSKARVARARADEEERQARSLESEIVLRLTRDLRLSRRAIGQLLGLSHAMVQRIFAAERRRRGSWEKGRRYGVAWGRGGK